MDYVEYQCGTYDAEAFFEAEAMAGFLVGQANEPTAWVAKALTVSMLHAGDALLDDLLGLNVLGLAAQLRRWLPRYVPNDVGRELLARLRGWCWRKWPSAHFPEFDEFDESVVDWWWAHGVEAVNWVEVASRVREELQRHRRCAKFRIKQILNDRMSPVERPVQTAEPSKVNPAGPAAAAVTTSRPRLRRVRKPAKPRERR